MSNTKRSFSIEDLRKAFEAGQRQANAEWINNTSNTIGHYNSYADETFEEWVQEGEILAAMEEHAQQKVNDLKEEDKLKSLIDQYFEENLIGKFSDEDSDYVKEIIRDFVQNYL